MLTRAVVLPPVLLAIVTCIFLALIFYLLWASRWVVHTDRVISQATYLLKLMVDGESGMRGYLITGDPTFLTPFHAAEIEANATFDDLLVMVADNPAQQERLNIIRRDLTAWNDYADNVVDLRREGGDFQTPVKQGQGKRRMEALRTQVSDFIDIENGLKSTRTRTAERATSLIVGLSLALALLFGTILAFLTRKRLLLVAGSYQKALGDVMAYAESLRKSAYRLENLHEIDRAILAADSVGELSHAALQRMQDIFACQEALVVVFDQASGPAQLIRAGAADPQPLPQSALAGVEESHFIDNKVARYVPDLSQLASRNPVQERLFQAGHRSCFKVPLEASGIRLGVLVLADRKTAAFSEEHRQVAEEMARQLAIAFQQSQLRQQLRQHAEELELRVEERTRALRTALASVTHLQGLLPICAWCKKVRDDKNYWHEVEHYVAAHTEARFTHGICPSCYKKNMSGLEKRR